MANLAHERLRRLFDAGRYDDCLREFAKIERERFLFPNELVQKGRCVLLGSGEVQPPERAEHAYLRALELDAEYAPALLELGWYYYATQDDAATALGYFEKAAAVSEDALKEAGEGRDKCLAEIRELEASEEA